MFFSCDTRCKLEWMEINEWNRSKRVITAVNVKKIQKFDTLFSDSFPFSRMWRCINFIPIAPIVRVLSQCEPIASTHSHLFQFRKSTGNYVCIQLQSVSSWKSVCSFRLHLDVAILLIHTPLYLSKGIILFLWTMKNTVIWNSQEKHISWMQRIT